MKFIHLTLKGSPAIPDSVVAIVPAQVAAVAPLVRGQRASGSTLFMRSGEQFDVEESFDAVMAALTGDS